MPEPTFLDKKTFVEAPRLYFEDCYRPRRDLKQAKEVLLDLIARSRAGEPDMWEVLYGLEVIAGDRTLRGQNFRGHFRKYLEPLQDTMCCYCRATLQNIAGAKPFEHILPSSIYPQFALHFWNIAVSCYNCNEKKKADDWCEFPKNRKFYPLPGLFKKSFHPRFHIHDEHVWVHRRSSGRLSVSAFLGLTDQGRHLCIKLLKHTAEREIRHANNQEFQTVLGKLSAAIAADTTGDYKKLKPFFEALSALMDG